MTIRTLAGACLLTCNLVACGGGGTADAGPPPATLSPDVVTGNAGDRDGGGADGNVTQARFGSIGAVGTSLDNIYVAEPTALRYVNAEGTVTTLLRGVAAIGIAAAPGGLATYAVRDAQAGTVAVRRLGVDMVSTTVATLPLAPRDTFLLFGAADGRLVGAQAERIVTIAEATGARPLAGVVTGHAAPVPVDGPADTARFGRIAAIAGDWQGNLYVIDGTLIRKITPTGTVTTLAGNPAAGLPQDGTGSAARFLAPFSLAVDGLGNVLVLDTLSGSPATMLRTVSPAGVVTSIRLADDGVRQLAGYGSGRVLAVRDARIDVLNTDGTTTPFVGRQPDQGTPPARSP